MRIGLFCTYENPNADYRSAYAEQGAQIELVERLGFDDVWVAEHHFNPESASPSLFALLAYLAGRTARVRLGAAAALLPFHNPILTAENAATLDLLSGGRFDFGVAKGGPFPTQNRHFGVGPEDSRERMAEALNLIEKLLTEDAVNFEGRFYRAEAVTVTPKPLQSPLPTFIATSTADMVRYCAGRGYGIMAGPPFPLAAVRDSLNLYRAGSAGGDPKLVLMRFFHLAPTAAQARDEARKLLAPFVERMQTNTASLQPSWTPWFNIDRVIDDSLIGTPGEVREKAARIAAELGPQSLVLKPVSLEGAKRRADLAAFAQRIRPALEAAEARA